MSITAHYVRFYGKNPAIDTPTRNLYHRGRKMVPTVIIDSHAHYTRKSYAQNFRYLSRNEESYRLGFSKSNLQVNR